jgi:hypothetical protein
VVVVLVVVVVAVVAVDTPEAEVDRVEADSVLLDQDSVVVRVTSTAEACISPDRALGGCGLRFSNLILLSPARSDQSLR